MEWSKLKTIIILMLLVVNLFLLVLVVHRQSQTAALTKTAMEEGIAVLEKNGIQVDRSVLPENGVFSILQISRDQTLETEIAQSVLGAVSKTELGGGVVSYSGTGGSAVFRSDGEFSFILGEGYAEAGRADILAHAMNLLEAMRFDTSADAVSVSEGAGETKIKAGQEMDGAPVFNCTAVFTYEGTRLKSISGKRLVGAPQNKGTETDSPSVLTMLFQLFRHVTREGDVCNAIIRVQAGYQMPSSLSGPMELVPVWMVETDTGRYYIGVETGAVERAS